MPDTTTVWTHVSLVGDLGCIVDELDNQIAYRYQNKGHSFIGLSVCKKTEFDRCFKPLPKRVSKWMNVYNTTQHGTGGSLKADLAEVIRIAEGQRQDLLHRLEFVYEGDKLVEVKVHDVPTDERS